MPLTLHPGETSLVIAGAWNPAILTPAWVLQYGLERAAGAQEQVQVALPAGQGLLFDFPRYTLAEFIYVVRPDALVINPVQHNADGFALIERATGEMLRHLPHTPLNGLGHNFEFRDTNPANDVLDIFTQASHDIGQQAPEGWDSATTLISSSFRVGAGNVFANVQRQFDGISFVIKFNFHHAITDVEQARRVLAGEGYARMHQNYEIARNLISNLYGPIA